MTTEHRAADLEPTDRVPPITTDSPPAFRRIVEQASVGIWTVDASGITDYANQRIADILGYTPAEMIGRRFTEFVRPASAVWAETAFDARKAGLAEKDGYCDLMTRDGRVIQVRYDASPIKDDRGTVVGALAIVSEIPTAEQEYLATLADRREREVASAYDLAPIGLCVINRSLQFTRVNRRFGAMDGVRSDAHLGRTIREVVAAIADEFERVVRTVLDTGEPMRDVEFVVGPGAPRVWNAEVSPIHDRAGIVLGVTVAIDDVTEPKEAEARLRQFAFLVQNASDFIGMCDLEFRPFFVNEAGSEAVTLAENPDATVLDFFFEEDHEYLRKEFFPKVLEEGRASVEIRFKDFKTGAPVWMQYSVVRMDDEAGRPTGYATISRNLTERRRAEAALSESRERLRAALDASGTGTFRWNIRTNEVDWDESLDRLFGSASLASPHTLEAFLSHVHPDDRASVLAQCGRCAREGVDFEMQFRVVWPDGSVRWLVQRGRSYVDESARPAYMTGACVDVTDRKRVGERLAHKRRILEMIAAGAPLESTLNAIVALLETHWPEATASIMLVDEAGRLSVGAAPGLPAQYLAAIEGIEIGPTAGSCGTAAFRREPVIASDIEHDELWADYRHLAVPHNLRACWSVPIVASTGAVVGTIAVYYREPRAPHESETDLATDAAASLAAIAIEKGLTERELHEKAQALAAANQNKDEFLAKLAHELRNPLGAIQAALEIFKLKMDEDSPLHRPRSVIDRQLRHIVRLIDDLSDMSRIGTGKIELRRERVDVAAIAADAADTVRPLAASRDQELHVELPGVPVFVEGDSARLTQVCVNLLTNAVKYTPPGGRIGLSLAESNGVVSIRVRDNGLGIPAPMLTKVFDLYAQADTVSEHAQGGLGIGLHLVQNLVKLHGGSVTAQSDGVGHGSEFEVRLPVDTTAAATL
jgi:PAS domain S-box-containing protein